MSPLQQLRQQLDAVIGAPGSPADAASRLCTACVSLLHVDGAAISLRHDRVGSGTFAASSELSRALNDLQLTLGEGPGVDAAATGRAVLAPDLADGHHGQWPMLQAAASRYGVRGVFAFPVSLSSLTVGALDLFRHEPGDLGADDLAGAGLAAQLASRPLLDLAREEADPEITAVDLQRVEVYQATGMLMGAWDVTPAEALVRLRAHAFVLDITAQQLAAMVVDRRVRLDEDGWA